MLMLILDNSKKPIAFKAFDIKSKKWNETGLVTSEGPYRQLAGSGFELIINTLVQRNEYTYARYYRLSVK